MPQSSNRRRFRPKAAGLPFNELLRIISPRIGSDAASQGRALPSGFGAAIGEAFIKANVQFYKDLKEDKNVISSAKKSGQDIQRQMSRCTFWRMAGPYQSLCTLSGSPVEVVSTSEILGFQCWEWAKRCRSIPPI
jgi:hypothetical protein